MSFGVLKNRNEVVANNSKCGQSVAIIIVSLWHLILFSDFDLFIKNFCPANACTVSALFSRVHKMIVQKLFESNESNAFGMHCFYPQTQAHFNFAAFCSEHIEIGYKVERSAHGNRLNFNIKVMELRCNKSFIEQKRKALRKRSIQTKIHEEILLPILKCTDKHESLRRRNIYYICDVPVKEIWTTNNK